MPETADNGRQRTAADAWGALLRVHATLVPELDRELQAKHHLPLAWYDVLLELNDGPGPAAPDDRTRRAGDPEPDPGQPTGGRDVGGRPGRPGGQSRRPTVGLRGADRQGPHTCSGRPRPPIWTASTSSSARP